MADLLSKAKRKINKVSGGRFFAPMTLAETYRVNTPIRSAAPSLPPTSATASTSSSEFFDFAQSAFNGSKFPGSLGGLKSHAAVDYWSLRRWSHQLYLENYYAKGLINRIVTNKINKGLAMEAVPDSKVLDVDSAILTDWSDKMESVYRLYSNMQDVVDYTGQHTMGQLEAIIDCVSMLSGDCLVILHQHEETKLPSIQLVDGMHVVNPRYTKEIKTALARGNTIKDGVERDSRKRHVAYHIQIETKDRLNIQTKRVPAFGAKSKRRTAFLVYGSRRRVDEVRGMPLLACVLYALKELDRYKDSEQRAAALNAVLAMLVTKEKPGIGSQPLGGGAVRKNQVDVAQPDGSTKSLDISAFLPGTIAGELAVGENVTSFNTQRPNVNFQVFEQAILAGISWGQEVPPEILIMAFNKSWAASRAAISEYKIVLDLQRADRAHDFNQPVYEEFAISASLNQVVDAPQLLAAWRSRDVTSRFLFAAWVLADWLGMIKPSIDLGKDVKAYKDMKDEGFITAARATRELNGTKYDKNVERLIPENERLAEARKPLIDNGLVQNFKAAPVEEPAKEPPAKQKDVKLAVVAERIIC